MNKQEKLINEIAKLNINTLTEEDIIRITCDYGLVYDPEWDCGEQTKYKVEGWNIPGIYQTPEQIAPCIMELLRHDIKTYLEIGIFQGGSYLLITNFLKLKNPDITCIAVDISDKYMSAEVKPYISEYNIGTSNDFHNVKFDLVFIDGDHSYEGVKTDWLNVGRFAKIAMFHDIVDLTCLGVVQLWNEIKEGKIYKEYCYQLANKDRQGIGLLFNEPI
jgi:hypothetical protein